jgi:formate hydrogenlyase subunit 4/hydrogenase-4 membrane subunit HyfE
VIHMALDPASILLAFLQVIFIFVLSPLFIGIMRKVKARLQGRTGSPVIQPYIDVLKLLSKGTSKSDVTTFVFTIAPVAGIVSVAIAALMLPILTPLPFIGVSIIGFVYLFAIGRFMTALSGLDAGSSFGGLGSSREMLYSVFIEPAIFAIILFLVAFGSGSQIGPLAASTGSWQDLALSPSYWLAIAALFVVILAETGRLPFDNPATHLELTMVHEAMILENSGPGLALVEWAHSAKLFLLFALMAVLFLPPVLQGSALMRSASVVAVAVVLAILTAIVESISVKVRLFKVVELLVLAMLLAILAFLANAFGAFLQGGSLTAALFFVMLLSSLYFLFSATFSRRIQLFLVQSACLVLIFLQQALTSGTLDSYFLLATTLVFKLLFIPLMLYQLFRVMPGEVKLLPMRFYSVFRETKVDLRLNLDFDPLFQGATVSPVRGLMFAGILIVLAFWLASVLGGTSILLPLALSLILTGLLIIAVKPHLLLQLMGFLFMENGVVLLPTALMIQLPVVGDAVTLFDVMVLIIVAMLLVVKIRGSVGSLDTTELDALLEKR